MYVQGKSKMKCVLFLEYIDVINLIKSLFRIFCCKICSAVICTLFSANVWSQSIASVKNDKYRACNYICKTLYIRVYQIHIYRIPILLPPQQPTISTVSHYLPHTNLIVEIIDISKKISAF